MLVQYTSTIQISTIYLGILFLRSMYSDTSSSKKLTCIPISSTAGRNVTLNPPPFNHHTTYVYWYRQIGKGTNELCRYVPNKQERNARIKFQCLNNYSLLLINVTASYNSNYTVKLDLGLGTMSITCYTLTVKTTTQMVKTTTRKPTTATSTTSTTTATTIQTTFTTKSPNTNVHSDSDPEAMVSLNETNEMQIREHTNLHAIWLLLPVLIVIICFFTANSKTTEL
ncbi:Cy23 [Cynomolgus cytomegalovirus]|uniref:Protein UL11 n=1 Tax=Cynomolgus macaque cytomegalovirus strain Mauritius TaxID=1690255 RepID=A0A0K1H022_9BETA|nr:Cy23 [Cynomolgus cytomegalovirus]AKT72755.1 protein UL11 [Cynomolgus macaque cytomegalovirus strain Mauritius]APT39238.1 Cy23 [Cynomolgus cytomegalovirus]APT39411.1 Cy23 [Cynomolgus cytomegalovirus]APT39584.1 Cy23 [Cynomolgus cytomegalovirus]APT39757.1 Cy23 [Cynomolgus cytomegalovirus]